MEAPNWLRHAFAVELDVGVPFVLLHDDGTPSKRAVCSYVQPNSGGETIVSGARSYPLAFCIADLDSPIGFGHVLRAVLRETGSSGDAWKRLGVSEATFEGVIWNHLLSKTTELDKVLLARWTQVLP